jgi:restriction system protein
LAPAFVLIDGSQLVEFICNYGLGTQVEQTFQIKRSNSEYWDRMDDGMNT